MKALVLSDSHGRLDNAKTALNKFYEETDAIFHLGDYYDDADTLHSLYPDCKLFAVSGNCDYHTIEPSTKIVEFAGKKIFLSHGHSYGVKSSASRIYYTALEANADLCLFGHTHEIFYVKDKNITILNPGSISMPRSELPSFAVVDFENDLKCDIYFIRSGKIIPYETLI